MKGWLAGVFVVLAATGCGIGDTGTSPTAVEASLVTEYFSNVVGVNGQRFYSFAAPRDSAISVMLASLSSSGDRALPTSTVGLGVGIPAGTGCALRESVVVTPALASQFSSWAAEGIHCVAVFDPGTLTEPVTFVVRITHY